MEKLIKFLKFKTIKYSKYKNKKTLKLHIKILGKEFKQIKPLIFKNRRYYSKKQVGILKLIKFLRKTE